MMPGRRDHDAPVSVITMAGIRTSVNKWARIEAIQRNQAFVAAYHQARALWKAGLRAVFPAGTYWLRRFAGVKVLQDPAPA